MSRHFQRSEFRCPHCGVALVRPLLEQKLEQLRRHLGRPIPIRSGYRCPPHNRQVGGAKDSQHMYGAAADIPSGVCPSSAAEHIGFTGIGTKGEWAIHVDVRDGPRARWTY